jgi:hypothetical protein
MTPLVQSLLVALIVSACALQAARKLAPKAAWRAQAALAFALEQPGRPGWLRAIGLRLRPAVSAAAGCASACPSCTGCGTTAPTTQDDRGIPLRLV